MKNTFTNSSNRFAPLSYGVNQFKTGNNDKRNKSNSSIINVNSQELFPSLSSREVTNKQLTTQDFKNALETVNIDPSTQEKKVQPGWVNIKRVNGCNVYEYGPNMITVNDDDDDINKVMNNIIEGISENRRRYIKQYDAIHDEGAYNEMFVLPPVHDYDEDDEDGSDDDVSID